MNKGLFSFFITIAIGAIVGSVVFGPNWGNPFASREEVIGETTFTAAEIDKIIADWPVVMAEVDDALIEYRNVGGSRTGEAAIRRGVQANIFARLGWPQGRGEYLISYLFMLRNSILKYSDQHRALGAFMGHYERNDAVSPELRNSQVGEIESVLDQINDAPDLEAFPSGDVALMVEHFEDFHTMLSDYGRRRGFVPRFSIAQ
jgi:hypothetical protein